MACMLRELIGIFHCFFYFEKNISLNKWQTYVIEHMVANIS